MVAHLNEDGGEERCIRASVKKEDIQNKTLCDFVTKNTKFFFKILGIKDFFLQIDPEQWSINEEYVCAQNMLKNFKVVNDSAECGVALITKFNRILTNDKEQTQYLLKIVADHRKQFPNACKKTLFK